MNKPILVNNEAEWLRLAPVLEKQGYVWSHGKEPTEFYPLLDTNKPFLLTILGKHLRFKVRFDTKTQTVDEYLALQEPAHKEDNIFNSAIFVTGLPVKEQSWEDMYWEMAAARTSATKEVQELKSKLEAQSRAIQEALGEIEKQQAEFIDSPHGTWGECRYKTFEKAKEILTQKLV